MTTEQAVKAIKTHLDMYIEEVPDRLLNTISEIINKTRTIIHKEIIMEDRKPEIPDLNAEWKRICVDHKLDPVKAKIGRERHKIAAKVHFIRYIMLNYQYVSLNDLARFFNLNHSTVIHARDRSKITCPIPPFYQKKRFIINSVQVQ